jgi:hypothetical protein
VKLIKEGHLPKPYYIEVESDRSHFADYSNADIEAHQVYALGQAQWLRSNRSLPAPPRWLEEIREVEDWVQAIQGRGGEVVFLRMPTTGALYSSDEFIFPKSRYWDAFARQTSAVCVHFKDWPQLADFECPDLSHLDRTDAPRFTDELARILADKGVLPSWTGTARQWAKADTHKDGRRNANHNQSRKESTDTRCDAPPPGDGNVDAPAGETEPGRPADDQTDDDWPDLPLSLRRQG